MKLFLNIRDWSSGGIGKAIFSHWGVTWPNYVVVEVEYMPKSREKLTAFGKQWILSLFRMWQLRVWICVELFNNIVILFCYSVMAILSAFGWNLFYLELPWGYYWWSFVVFWTYILPAWNLVTCMKNLEDAIVLYLSLSMSLWGSLFL